MFLLSRKIAVFFSLLYIIIFSPGFAVIYAQQASNSPSPSASATASPSPSDSPSPTSSATPTSSPTSSPSPSSTSFSPVPSSTAKGQVLGAATSLGLTSSDSDIIKWLFGGGLVIVAVFIGIIITRTNVEE